MLGELIAGNISFIEAIVYILSTLAVIFLTLPVHEFAHAFVADKLGDPTPRYQGRLTLNPFAHIDYIGSLCILAFGFGWAKPVEVNNFNFRKPKLGMAAVAVAGPLSNIILALISLLLSNLFFVLNMSVALNYIAIFFIYIAQINVYLAVFNLIPIPPLDGSRILSIILPDKYYYKLMRYERYIYYGLLALLVLGVLDGFISNVSSAVLVALDKIASLPFAAFWS